MRIVRPVVIDQTRPVEQKGFKSAAIFDFTTAHDAKIVYGTKDIDEGSTDLIKLASAFFASGGTSLLVAGKNISSESEVSTELNKLAKEHDFYALTAVVKKSNQKAYYAEIEKFVNGNEKLAVLEINGTESEVKTAKGESNSDRVVYYANSKDEQDGKAAAVLGACIGKTEGSITWGNQVVTGTGASGYEAADEAKLMKENINYITKEMGRIFSQYGRTTSGSNADITRSKDWLCARASEELTALLLNMGKVMYTDRGLASISSTLNTVGAQAVAMGMLDRFYAEVPLVKDIPFNDKANRVLKGVKFNCWLTGAVESIDLEIPITLA